MILSPYVNSDGTVCQLTALNNSNAMGCGDNARYFLPLGFVPAMHPRISIDSDDNEEI